jgi:mRNA-degrading endonuclease RelE of RelBE toxin-antitoxin system
VTVTVHNTQRAAEQVSALRKRDRALYDQFLAELRSQGCGALGYRLAGDVVDHLCVKHLRGALRVVVGFVRPTEVVVVLVGPHQDDDPAIDVYAALYRLAGLSQPPADERTKPPCCGEEDGLPPADEKIVEDLVSRSQELAKADRRRARRR